MAWTDGIDGNEEITSLSFYVKVESKILSRGFYEIFPNGAVCAA